MNNSFLNNDDISDFLKYLAYELNFDKGQIIDVVVTPHKYKIEYNIFLVHLSFISDSIKAYILYP